MYVLSHLFIWQLLLTQINISQFKNSHTLNAIDWAAHYIQQHDLEEEK